MAREEENISIPATVDCSSWWQNDGTFPFIPQAPDPPNWVSLFKRPNLQRHGCQPVCFQFQIQLYYLWLTTKLTKILLDTDEKPDLYVQTQWKRSWTPCTFALPLKTHTHTNAGIYTHTAAVEVHSKWSKSASTSWHSKENIWPKEAQSVCMCERVYECVFEGEKKEMDIFCMHVLQKHGFWVHVNPYLCVFKASESYCCSVYVQMIWQCNAEV